MTEEVTPTTEPACDTFVLEQAFVFIYLYPLVSGLFTGLRDNFYKTSNK